jgi:GTP cyclohydrolase II
MWPSTVRDASRNQYFRQHPVRRRFNATFKVRHAAKYGCKLTNMPLSIASDQHGAVASAMPDAAALSLRAVHRAAAELRRGTPVMLRGGDHVLVIAAAETVGATGLAELSALAKSAPVLLLAPSRAAAVAPAPALRPVSGVEEAAVALRLPPSLLDPAMLRSLADPTAERLPEGSRAERLPAPPLAAAALALAKLGRLLPAVIAAPHAALARDALSRQDLLTVEAADVLAYPIEAAASLRRVAEAAVPLEGAPDSRIIAFRAADGGIEHLAILVGQPEALAAKGGAPLARLHSECFTGDLLGSLRCDCGPQLRGAIQRMGQEGAGVLIYLAQEGRGIGLVNKLRAYTLQDTGLDTLDANRALGWGADERNFMVAATMLEQLGINRVRLLTNNPEKLASLAACGIGVEGREQHSFAPNGVNDHYLDTKARRFGHLLA